MQSKAKKHRWWFWAAAAAAVSAMLLATGKSQLPVVEAAHPQVGDISRTASAYGRIQPVTQVTISPDVSGEIMEINFDEGDTVKRGDLLFKIKQESYLNSIARCQAALGSALKTLEVQDGQLKLKLQQLQRLEKLCAGEAAPASQLEEARIAFDCAQAQKQECEFQVAAARANLEAARSELAKTLVYAPIDGIVTALRAKAGERVVGTGTMAGTEIMTIANLERMELVVQLGQNDICSVSTGNLAQIRPDAAPSSILEGTVDKIAVSASGSGQIVGSSDFEIRISIDNQSNIKLLPGMSASVTIYTGSKNDILTVPLQAIMVRDGQETVWTVAADGRVHSVPVSCGIQDFSRVEITGGLFQSDLVVTGPFQTISKGLKEADKVKLSKDAQR